MTKKHVHDLAFLDGGEGVYCMDADCDFTLIGDNLLSVLRERLTMANERLILERTIELLVVAGHVTQGTVDKARQIALSYEDSCDDDFDLFDVDPLGHVLDAMFEAVQEES